MQRMCLSCACVFAMHCMCHHESYAGVLNVLILPCVFASAATKSGATLNVAKVKFPTGGVMPDS